MQDSRLEHLYEDRSHWIPVSLIQLVPFAAQCLIRYTTLPYLLARSVGQTGVVQHCMTPVQHTMLPLLHTMLIRHHQPLLEAQYRYPGSDRSDHHRNLDLSYDGSFQLLRHLKPAMSRPEMSLRIA